MKLNIRTEFEYFLIALAFFTRIPIPKWVDFSPSNLQRASRYYATVGFIVGGLTAGCFSLSHLFFSTSISVLLSMCFSIYLTGAFHEDGFADCCDGFGGGYSIEQKLRIMKDSRVGTYAVVGLVLILLLKWQLLVELNSSVPIALVVSHTLSRMLAGSMTFCLPYVRRSEDSKVEAFTLQTVRYDLLFLLISGCFLSSIFLPISIFFTLIVTILLIWIVAVSYLKKSLNGYTGDCLGAIQQICELALYFVLLYVLYPAVS